MLHGTAKKLQRVLKFNWPQFTVNSSFKGMAHCPFRNFRWSFRSQVKLKLQNGSKLNLNRIP